MKFQSSLLRQVLKPACELWLRSQLEAVEQLRVGIVGGDRQLLGGYLPQVSLSAVGAVYRGIVLGCVDFKAEEIRLDVGGLWRGEPLQLLAAVWLLGEVSLKPEELSASLASPLLSSALASILNDFLEIEVPMGAIAWQRGIFGERSLCLQGFWGEERVELQVGIDIEGSVLSLQPLIWQRGGDRLEVKQVIVPLGEQVAIEEFELSGDRLALKGKIIVLP